MLRDARLLLGCLLCATVIAAVGVEARAGQAEFVVVAHAGAEIPSDRAAAIGLLRDLYLKRRSAWPGGQETRPFARPRRSPEHARLLVLLGLSEAELRRHWLSLKQRTGQVAPREIESDKILLALVRRYPGSFGVVSAEAAAGSADVEILFPLP